MRLQGREAARAYLGLLRDGLGEVLNGLKGLDDHFTTAALVFEQQIETLKVRDGHSNVGVRNRMADAMDDHLYELERTAGTRIPHLVRDALFEKGLSVARHSDGHQA